MIFNQHLVRTASLREETNRRIQQLWLKNEIVESNGLRNTKLMCLIRSILEWQASKQAIQDAFCLHIAKKT